MTVVKIRIRQYEFSLSEPFAEGTVITEGEAQALNGLRAENIRNRMARVVANATASLDEGELLSTEAVAELQAQITRYDSRYQFVKRHVANATTTVIASEAKAIAEAELAMQQQALGLQLDPDELAAELERLIASERVQQQARARASRRLVVSQQALEELL